MCLEVEDRGEFWKLYWLGKNDLPRRTFCLGDWGLRENYEFNEINLLTNILRDFDRCLISTL